MQSLWVVSAVLSGLALGAAPGDDEAERKFADCPPAVRKTFEAETKGAKIDTVTLEKEGDDEVIYWADVSVGGWIYAIGVLEDGTLAEMNLAVDEDEILFHRCPDAVQATFGREAFGEKVEVVGKDRKYGVTIYEAHVTHKGKSYEIVVAEDGTLVEKVLVIEDEEVELSTCPPSVQAALREQAKGGTIRDITRSTGIGRHTYEAEVEVKGRIYLVEVGESGLLISKSLEAGEE